MRFAFLALALLPATACHASWEKDGRTDGHTVQPSGKGGTRSFAASGFTGVDLRGPDDVDVRTGGAFSVTAEGDTAILDQLEIQVVDGTLRVGRKDRAGFSFSDDHGVKVRVTMPKLTAASISGSGDMSVDKAEGDFKGAIAGSGNLGIGALTATDADLSIAGSGDLRVAGSGGKLSASIAGSGDIDAAKFTASSADISIAGSGSVRGVVKGDAKVSLIGSGDVELTGGAKCSVSSMGSGEARCS